MWHFVWGQTAAEIFPDGVCYLETPRTSRQLTHFQLDFDSVSLDRYPRHPRTALYVRIAMLLYIHRRAGLLVQEAAAVFLRRLSIQASPSRSLLAVQHLRQQACLLIYKLSWHKFGSTTTLVVSMLILFLVARPHQHYSRCCYSYNL